MPTFIARSLSGGEVGVIRRRRADHRREATAMQAPAPSVRRADGSRMFAIDIMVLCRPQGPQGRKESLELHATAERSSG